MKTTTNSISNLKSVVDNLMTKQKKIPVKNISVENDDKEISTELVIPNLDARGENMNRWRETFTRAFGVASINEELSSQLNREIMKLVEKYEY